MTDLIIKSNIAQQKSIIENSAPSTRVVGLPVYVANLLIGKSTLKAEISKSNGPNQEIEVPNSDEGIEEILLLFRIEQIKGVRLNGLKKDCAILSSIFLRHGIRALITTSQKGQTFADKQLKGIPVINQFVAGIDIGKSLIVVSVPPHLSEDHTQAFGTFTDDLEVIIKWLKELGITEIAMESTSVYWIPLQELCELNNIKVLIVNPKHVKMLPGRKTDVLDAQWLMRLLACGMLRGGFIPSLKMRALRDLARHRQEHVDRAGDSLNRMHKALSMMNIQLSLVLSDISGKSATTIIKSIINGERDSKKLASLVEKGCKCSITEIERALHGTYSEENIFILKQEQQIFEFFHGLIIETESKIKLMLERLPDAPELSPIEEASKRQRKKTEYNRSPYCFDLRPLLYLKFGYDLTKIPGIDCSTAATIIFETGGNMDAFPTEKHFASWCGVCPGNKISGGKILSGKAPKKFSRVGQAFRVAANANCKSDSAIGAHLRRLIRNGKTKKTARKATAHKIGVMVYNTIKYGQKYVEKGAEAYEKAYEKRKIAGCIRTLESSGYDCSKIEKRKS